jgi:predicted nucleic acid-binding protein
VVSRDRAPDRPYQRRCRRAYFLQIEPGGVEASFLDALARSELVVEATTTQDFARMADLVRQYADFPLGTADASVIAVAERLGATHVAMINHRHFLAVRPAHCAAFELLPGL